MRKKSVFFSARENNRSLWRIGTAQLSAQSMQCATYHRRSVLGPITNYYHWHPMIDHIARKRCAFGRIMWQLRRGISQTRAVPDPHTQCLEVESPFSVWHRIQHVVGFYSRSRSPLDAMPKELQLAGSGLHLGQLHARVCVCVCNNGSPEKMRKQEKLKGVQSLWGCSVSMC